jgi:hypothetical protein
LAKVLEPRALRGADFITSVSDIQNIELAARYSWLDSRRMASLPIGGDRDDFIALRRSPVWNNSKDLETEFINFSFVGTFMPRSEEVVRALFRAFRRLRGAHPSLAAQIRLNFIGTSNQPIASVPCRVRGLAEKEGIAEAVLEIPQRVPYMQALSVLTRSDVLLLIGSDEPHYTASKIYPALMSERPFLSIFHHASSAHEILSHCGGGVAIAFADEEELAALEVPLSDALYRLATRTTSFGVADRLAYASYEARATAQKFADIFDRLLL